MNIGVLFDDEDSIYVVGMTYGNLTTGGQSTSSSDPFVVKVIFSFLLQKKQKFIDWRIIIFTIC